MNGQGEMIPDRGSVRRKEQASTDRLSRPVMTITRPVSDIVTRNDATGRMPTIHDRNEPADNLSQHVGRQSQQTTVLMPIRHVQYAAEPFRIRTNLDATADLTSLMQQA